MLSKDEYQDEIAKIAREVTAEAREWDRHVHDVLHDTLDAHPWIVYTEQAQEVLRVSSEPEPHAIGPNGEKLWNNNWSAMAFSAMAEDVAGHPDFDADEDEDEE